MKNSVDLGGCYLTPSELYMLRKPNSLIALWFVQNISQFLKEFRHFAFSFSAHKNNTTSSPGFLGQRFNNLQRASLLTSSIQYDKVLSFSIWSIAAGYGKLCGDFNQSETGKYFDWSLIMNLRLSKFMFICLVYRLLLFKQTASFHARSTHFDSFLSSSGDKFPPSTPEKLPWSQRLSF